VYSKLVSIAEDRVTAPASQAYVERIFSLYGMLTNAEESHAKVVRNASVFEVEQSYCINDVLTVCGTWFRVGGGKRPH